MLCRKLSKLNLSNQTTQTHCTSKPESSTIRASLMRHLDFTSSALKVTTQRTLLSTFVLLLYYSTSRISVNKHLTRSSKQQRSTKLCLSHGITLASYMRSASRMMKLLLPTIELLKLLLKMKMQRVDLQL